jgi:hypothetical protein
LFLMTPVATLLVYASVPEDRVEHMTAYWSIAEREQGPVRYGHQLLVAFLLYYRWCMDFRTFKSARWRSFKDARKYLSCTSRGDRPAIDDIVAHQTAPNS